MNNKSNIAAPKADKPATEPAYLKTRYTYLRKRSTTGTFYLWFKHKGKRHNPSLETEVESVALVRAKQKMKDISEQVASGAPVANKGALTFGDMLANFLKHNEARIDAVTDDRITRSSYDAIEDGVSKIKRDKAEWLTARADKLTEENFKDYLAAVGKEYSPTTYNKVCDAIKNSYALALDQKVLAANPTLRLKRASLHAVKSDVVLTDDQYAKLVEYLTGLKNNSRKFHVLDVVEFLRFFGARIAEAGGILKDDVQLDKDWETNGKHIVGTVWIRKEFSKRATKKRGLPVIREAAPLIARCLARVHPRGNYLLPIKDAYISLRNAYQKLGYEVHGHHHFRHLAATKWIECGVNIKVVAELLGHKDGGKLALQTYSHVRTKAVEHEVGKISWGGAQITPSVIVNGKAYTVAELAKLIPAQPANVLNLAAEAA